MLKIGISRRPERAGATEVKETFLPKRMVGRGK
jgi:hypothetical protein